MSYPTLTDPGIIEKIRSMRLEGFQIREIMQALHLGRRVVSRHARGLHGPVHRDTAFTRLPEILKLRSEGKTLKEIGQLLGYSAANICLALDGSAIPESVIARNQQTCRDNRQIGVRRRDNLARHRRQQLCEASAASSISVEDAFMAGLYVGEGAKTTGRFGISNSHPEVVGFCVRYLISHGVQAHQLCLIVNLHSDTDADVAVKFWRGRTKLPAKSVKPYILKSTSTPVTHTLLYGTVNIYIRGRLGLPLFEKMRGIASHFAPMDPHRYKGDPRVSWQIPYPQR